jgi:hypothetical protein
MSRAGQDLAGLRLDERLPISRALESQSSAIGISLGLALAALRGCCMVSFEVFPNWLHTVAHVNTTDHRLTTAPISGSAGRGPITARTRPRRFTAGIGRRQPRGPRALSTTATAP